MDYNRLISDNSKFDLVPLGVKPPMVKGQHRIHPNPAAHALNTDIFALQIRGGFDRGVNHDGPREFINKPAMKTATSPPAMAPSVEPVGEPL